MIINSYAATEILKDELACYPEIGFSEEPGTETLMWSHEGRDYLVSLVLFDVTKEEV